MTQSRRRTRLETSDYLERILLAGVSSRRSPEQLATTAPRTTKPAPRAEKPMLLIAQNEQLAIACGKLVRSDGRFGRPL
jgi:hypothetical protein